VARLPPRRNVFGRAVIATALLAIGAGPGVRADEPSPAPKPAAGDEGAATKVIVIAPDDLAAFWKKLNDPDFIWMTGEEFRKRLKGAGVGPPAAPGAGVVAMAIRGKVVGELAQLAIESEIAVTGPDAAWAPIRLDGLAVTRAREGDRDLPLRQAEKGGWQVELRGAGRHEVRVELPVPVKAGAEGRTLALAIPEAASTQVALDVGADVLDATANGRDVVAVESVQGVEGKRLAAHLAARPRLELTWHLAAEPGAPLPPLLATRGEIVLEVGHGEIRATSSWSVRAERGTTRALELKLDPAEELVELALDLQPLPAEGTRDRAASTVTIPLPEPLRPGASRRLAMTTRRPLPAGAPARWTYSGAPMAHAAAQSGIVAVLQGEDLWIGGAAGRGLIQIDPRDELPDTLRRPSTVLAYRFLDQPFDLALRADPSPPRVRATTRSAVAVDPAGATVDAWIDYRATRGRVFEVRVALPPDLDLKAAGPAEVVEAWQSLAGGRDGPAAGRVAAIRLKAKPRDEGAFRIHLTGRQAFPPAPAPTPPGTVAVGLFRAEDAEGGETVAVVPARDVSAELAGDGAGFVTTPAPGPSAGWPGPPERPAAAAWLRHDGNPAALPLRVAALARTVEVEAAAVAGIGRHRVEIRQDATCHARHGLLARLDVAVPRALEGRWEVEGPEVAGHSRLGPGPGPDGSTVHRIALRREDAESVRLRFRCRLPLEPALGPGEPRRIEIPLVRILDAAPAAPRLDVVADPGIELDPAGPGWSAAPAGVAGPAAPRRSWAGADAGADRPVVFARAPELAALPPLVASRLWLRTVVLPEGGQQTSAWYRVEVRPATLAVALPEGAAWVGARIDGEAVGAVERLAESGGFRLRFPAGTPAGPALVGLDYVVPPRSARGRLAPPLLLEGGLVQQTLWEVRVPWSRAAVGVPADWTDENTWGWDRYVWKRRPWKDAEALAAWVAAPAGRPFVADDAGGGRGDYHGYLFGRPGDPVPMTPWIAPRAGLVGLFSGSVLAFGLPWLVGRPRGRWLWPVAPALALAVGAALQPGATLLAAQSSVVGVALFLLAAAARRLAEHRRPAARFGAPSGQVLISPAGPAAEPAALVGSDHSTVIRPRAASTIDHAPTAGADSTPGVSG